MPSTVTVTLSPIISASPTRRVRISMLASPLSPAFLSERAKMIAQRSQVHSLCQINGLGALQFKGLMQRSHGALEVFLRNEHADLDLRRRDQAHVDAFPPQR